MQLVTVRLIRDIVQVDLQMLCKLGWSSCKATGSGPRSDALTASCRGACAFSPGCCTYFPTGQNLERKRFLGRASFWRLK